MQDIYVYYRKEATESVARRVIRTIREKAHLLADHPMLGLVDMDLLEPYRSIVVLYWKLIYRINGDQIIIVRVFDARQDPGKKIDDLITSD